MLHVAIFVLIAEEEVDPEDSLVKEMIAQGKHKNLSFLLLLQHQRLPRWKCLGRSMRTVLSIRSVSIA